jgi:hypothetical protein
VQPTVIEPLRQSWAYVQGAAVLLANEGKQKGSHRRNPRLPPPPVQLRVLDPACGSGNFLYVALEHLKRLEGEVLNQLHDIGHGQAMLEAEGSPSIRTSSSASNSIRARRPSPNWCCGSATCNGISARAARPAAQPVLKDFRNIECRDAVLAHDGVDYVLDDGRAGQRAGMAAR